MGQGELQINALETPDHLLLPRGMLSASEHKLLYHLTRDHFSGRGWVIDGGAFAGASSYCLAAGVVDNPATFERSGIVHAYDHFIADEGYIQTSVQELFFTSSPSQGGRVCLTVPENYDFEDIFRWQIAKYAAIVTVHKGDLLQFSCPPGRPIEILFIDIAKTSQLNSHLFSAFMPHLISGGVLIQQDFMHIWHSYIHVSMEYLSAYFDIIAPSVGVSRVYRLRTRIPDDDLERVVRYDFSRAERIRLLEATLDKSAAGHKPLLRVVLAREHYLDGDKAAFEHEARRALEPLPTGGRNHLLSEIKKFAAGFEL